MMAADESSKLRIKARSMTAERNGDLRTAVETFLQAGMWEDCVRIFHDYGYYKDAARLILKALNVDPANPSTFSDALKHWIIAAGTDLARVSDYEPAIRIFFHTREFNRAGDLYELMGKLEHAEHMRNQALSPSQQRVSAPGLARRDSSRPSLEIDAGKLEKSGKTDAALRVYVASRNWEKAAKTAASLGMLLHAVEYAENANDHALAGRLALDIGDRDRCMRNLTRVNKENPTYRQCSRILIQEAGRAGVLPPGAENMLARYMYEPPGLEPDMHALYHLALLFEQERKYDEALQVAENLQRTNPAYRDITDKVKALRSSNVGAALRPVSMRRPSLPEMPAVGGGMPVAAALPDLPDVPSLPVAPTMPAGQQSPLASRFSSVDLAAIPGRDPTPAPSRPQQSTVFAKPMNQSNTMSQPLPATDSGSYTTSRNHSDSAPAPVSQSKIRATVVRSPTVPPSSPPPPAAAPPAVVKPTADLAPGSVLDNRYRIESVLGRGGNAIVYKATDTELDETIAIKILTQSVEDEESLTRFRQELKLSRQLSHPNIVQLYHIGIHAGFRYICMELLEGQDMKKMMTAPFPFLQGFHLMMQACAGLQVAHSRGVVHRDIKPENLFVTKNNQLKIMDFGIAKQLEQNKNLTMAGTLSGTPKYMSPEQIRAFSEVGPASDLYSLGVVMYEMFTGRPPFFHGEIVPLLMMHLNDNPVPPSRFRQDMPVEMEDVILKLLNKDPAQRHASCQELAMDIARIEVLFRNK